MLNFYIINWSFLITYLSTKIKKKRLNKLKNLNYLKLKSENSIILIDYYSKWNLYIWSLKTK